MSLSRIFLIILILVTGRLNALELERPRLLISNDDVALVSASGPAPPLFATALAAARAQIEPWLDDLPDVPVPVDAGGGYTHEQHKSNGYRILNAGSLYQLTGESVYAEFTARMLLAYADMYPSLAEHPQKKEQSPGRLFWQSLNEAVWLVTVIQGYDAAYEFISDDQRNKIEDGLLRPMADFLSKGQPKTFDRIHNHGTWAVAAVGMTGFVLDDADYVTRALYGLQKDGSAGFMKQLDQLFSPDGYYSEGPYYQRYALLPFLLFAKAIERNEPQRDIFAYRDGILLKAIHTTIQLSYDGLFFPINDAIKDKGIDTIELVYGVAIAYGMTGDASLLPIASRQGRTVLTGDGFRVAQALEQGLQMPYPFRTLRFADGSEGDQGMLAVLRGGSDDQAPTAVFKATAQGMGHGHFDKLAWLFYDNGQEILPDYGAARFLNVVSKNGGHYLPENTSWAKQTVAHNTLVVDETSHFGGDWKRGMKYPPTRLLFATTPDLDIAAARMTGAYDDVMFERALVLLKKAPFEHPVVLDVLRVSAGAKHRFDLPLHFKGQITDFSHTLQPSLEAMSALSTNNGYQHLWKRAVADADKNDLVQLTWLNSNRFYTHSALAGKSMSLIFAETGANDPNFNLRKEQVLVQRIEGAESHTFVSVIEPHGEYNGVNEFTVASESGLETLSHTGKSGLDLVRIKAKNGAESILVLSFDPAPHKHHRLEAGGEVYEWDGFYRLFNQ